MPTPAFRRLALTLATALVAATAACSSGSPGAAAPAAATSAAAPSGSAGRELTLAYFTDSWGAGNHCGGCTAWPQQLAPDYDKKYGVRMRVVDFANRDGGDTDQLLTALRTDPSYRKAVAAADVVVFNQGVNDFDQFDEAVFAPIRDGRCHGPACLSALTDHWTKNLRGFADVVQKLRGGQPTALRFVGVSNEFLSDSGLSSGLGGPKTAQAVFASFNTVSCAVARGHHGACVDLRPVLNGPGLDRMADPNSAQSMQAVANAIVDLGLPELGVGGS